MTPIFICERTVRITFAAYPLPDMHPPRFTEILPGGAQLEMILVEGGAFDMGGADAEAEKYEKPVRPVRLRSFYLGQYPVTQAQWTAVMGQNPSGFKGENRPVENVSWFDAAVFCNALGEALKKEPCYFGDDGFKTPFGKTSKGWELPNDGAVYLKPGAGGYRLPSEAEWEYAARGGPYWKSEGYRYAGSDLLRQVGWYEENSGNETHDVGLLLPNALGLFDMSGNVWEWCEDQWHDNYQNAPDDGSAWVGLEQGRHRVCRGGSFFDHARYCRVAYRPHFHPAVRSDSLGFRLVLSLQSAG